MAPVIGPNFNAHASRKFARTQAPEEPFDGNTTVKDLTSWVGDDKARAQAVLVAEQEGENRPTLIAAMEEVISYEDPNANPEGENAPENGEEGSEAQSTPEGEGEAESTPETAEETSAPEIPEGVTNVKPLQEWVGDDPAKAQVVLDAEQAKPEAERRKTLVTAMGAIVNADGSDLI